MKPRYINKATDYYFLIATPFDNLFACCRLNTSFYFHLFYKSPIHSLRINHAKKTLVEQSSMCLETSEVAMVGSRWLRA